MVITGGRAALSGPDREAPTPVTIKLKTSIWEKRISQSQYRYAHCRKRNWAVIQGGKYYGSTTQSYSYEL